MKNLILLLLSASLFVWTACSKDSVTNETQQVLDDALQARFSGASNVTWASANEQIYEASFKHDAKNKKAGFTKEGNLKYTQLDRDGDGDCNDDDNSDELDLSTVPQSVKDYLAQHYAGYEIKEAEKETEHGVTYYEVEIINGTEQKELIFDSNWVFVKESAEHHDDDDHDGDGEDDEDDDDDDHDGDGDGDDDDHDGDHDGDHNGDDSEHFNISEIPASAVSYINTHYAGFTIKEAEKETEDGVTFYDVEIKKGEDEKDLIFDANWNFLREE